MEKNINIDGVVITPDMIETLKDWQNEISISYPEFAVDYMDKLSGILLNNWNDMYGSDAEIKDCLIFIHHLKSYLKKFVIKKNQNI